MEVLVGASLRLPCRIIAKKERTVFGVTCGFLRKPSMKSPLGFEAETTRERLPVPGGRDFSTGWGATAEVTEKVIDSSGESGGFLPVMSLNFPYLPTNPLRLRATCGMGAEGMRQEFPSNNAALRVASASWLRFFGVDRTNFTVMKLFYGLAVPPMVNRIPKIPLSSYYMVIVTPVLKLGLELSSAGLIAGPWIKPDYILRFMAGFVLGPVFSVVCWCLNIRLNGRSVILRKLRSATGVENAA